MYQYYVNVLRLMYGLEVRDKHGRDHVGTSITVHVPYSEDVAPAPPRSSCRRHILAMDFIPFHHSSDILDIFLVICAVSIYSFWNIYTLVESLGLKGQARALEKDKPSP